MIGNAMYCVLLLLVYVSAQLVHVHAEQCTEIRFSSDQTGRRLNGYLIYTFEADTLSVCLYECSMVTHCLSVNYGRDNNTCELNSANSTTANWGNFSITNDSYIYTDIHAWTKIPVGKCIHKPCPGKEMCMPATNPVCVEMVCSNNAPAVSGAVINTNHTGVYYMGDTISYTCPHPEMYMVGKNTIRCGRFAKWTPNPQSECKRPETCAELPLCNSTYQDDGEYWLFPRTLSGKKIKVYCYGMGTGTPWEFITVDSLTNVVHYAGKANAVGAFTSYFSKIRINTINMKVDRSVISFSPSNDGLGYAEGSDCDCESGCKFTGYFRVDTNGTGLIVDPTLTWRVEGTSSQMINFTRSADNLQISALCGGNCGDCEPTRDMILQLNPSEDIPDSQATLPSCVVPVP